jgi:hypothetical protein
MLSDLDSLLLFLRALELGSLSKAAEHSNMAASVASHLMVLLENRSAMSQESQACLAIFGKFPDIKLEIREGRLAPAGGIA